VTLHKQLLLTLTLAALAVMASVARVAGQAGGGSPPAVQYWAAADSFKAGTLLLDRMASRHYNMYAVRRDAPGRPELHERDTDIVLVLEGAATFVTGGTVKDPSDVGPGEKTGSGIEDGSPHRLEKGDVIVVPNGVPHWFTDVSPSIRYFAVKLRQESATPSLPSSVFYWTAAKAFAPSRGPLSELKAGPLTRVYAITRSMAMNVELHELDTDLVFVIGGAGTFVTNGSIVEPRPLAANESTGSGIRDGTARSLSPGAVLVVPAGTPHWLRDIDGTVQFFAVKVR
jgi:mannose-6-phosphate isomerase-like protein (cupin superfamily)